MAKDTPKDAPKGSPKDPAQMFQEWVTQWERATDSFSNKLMGSEDFSKYLNQMQGAQIEFQRGFGELMSKQLANLNMPSREDVLKLSEDLQGLDRRMARIEASLHQLTTTQDSGTIKNKKMPPRTKKPSQAQKDPE